MTNSYLTVSLKLARKGWKHFSLNVTDAVIGTESELVELDSGKTLGAEIGDIADTVMEILAVSEHYTRYIRFNKDTIGKVCLPGPQANLLGPAGTELTGGGAMDYKGEFTPFKVDSGWSLTANCSADGTGA